MIDLKKIRENPDLVGEGLLKRGEDVDLSILLGLDQQRREKITEVEGIKSRKNQVSQEISALRKESQSTDALVEEMKVESFGKKVFIRVELDKIKIGVKGNI